MKKWIRNLMGVSFLAALIVAGGVRDSEAAGYGHRSDDAAQLISSLDLTAPEQAALASALSTYGPAVRTAWRQLHAAKKQLRTDLQATPPVGSTLVADAAAVATAKAQLKGASDQLNGALNAALTPPHLQQLQAQLAARSQSRLDAKTGHLLLNYARYLEKQ